MPYAQAVYDDGYHPGDHQRFGDGPRKLHTSRLVRNDQGGDENGWEGRENTSEDWPGDFADEYDKSNHTDRAIVTSDGVEYITVVV